jgi:hypothetical protein
MPQTPPFHQPAPVSRRTVRLRFEYEGDKVRLVFARKVEMITPPATETALGDTHSGAWVELRDARGKMLYQRAIHSPVRTDQEIFSEDPKTPISRVPAENMKGVFEVLIPDLPEGATVHVMSSKAGQRESLQAAAEMIGVDLRKLAKEGQ